MLSLLDTCTIVRVQSWEVSKSAPSQVEQVVGVACARESVEIVCVGPADWLVIAREAARLPLLESLGEAFRDSTFRATDVSAALVRIRIEGEGTLQVIAKACSLDLDPQAFAVGASARTRFAGLAVVLRRLGPSVFECMVSLSLRDYLMAWLDDAAESSPSA